MKTFEKHRQTYPLDSKYAKLMAEYAIISPMDSWGWGKNGVWEVWRDWLIKNRVSLKDAKAILEAQDRGMVHQTIGHEIRTKGDLDEVARRLKIAARRNIMSSREEKMASRIALDVVAESGDTEYQEFFRKKLEEHGVESPAELDEGAKKKFFDEVDREWTGEKTASRRSARDGEYRDAVQHLWNSWVKFSREYLNAMGKMQKAKGESLEFSGKDAKSQRDDLASAWSVFDNALKRHASDVDRGSFRASRSRRI